MIVNKARSIPSPGDLFLAVVGYAAVTHSNNVWNRLVVRVGDSNAVEVLELQPAGKKRMTAEEFLRGYPIQDGYRFGPERLP